jgi:branched-chain amino acid aminotransferase
VCKENNIPCYEKNFTFKDIEDCQEAFVTGTFGGIVPVSILENKSLHSIDRKSLTNKIKKLYLQDIENYIKSKS